MASGGSASQPGEPFEGMILTVIPAELEGARRLISDVASFTSTPVHVAGQAPVHFAALMPFPPDHEIASAIVDHLQKRGGSAPIADVASALVKQFRLTEADVARTIPHSSRPNGESAWRQRLRRVRHSLVKSGQLAAGSARGVWMLAVKNR